MSSRIPASEESTAYKLLLQTITPNTVGKPPGSSADADAAALQELDVDLVRDPAFQDITLPETHSDDDYAITDRDGQTPSLSLPGSGSLSTKPEPHVETDHSSKPLYTLYERFGWLAATFLIAGCITLLGVLGFLWFIWLGNYHNPTWHKIATKN
jgi:hypothetical protein